MTKLSRLRSSPAILPITSKTWLLRSGTISEISSSRISRLICRAFSGFLTSWAMPAAIASTRGGCLVRASGRLDLQRFRGSDSC